MGNVEWVTCQVPVSHSAAGGLQSVADGDFAVASVCEEGCRIKIPFGRADVAVLTSEVGADIAGLLALVLASDIIVWV